MERNPRVSVVIPTCNRARLLPRAVQSVLDQDFQDLELIIVNDGSEDETFGVMRSLAKSDERVRLVSHSSNRGPSSALNSGIRSARGGYISFLDDDDEWLPGKLSAQVDLLDRSPPHVGAVYCWFYFVDAQTGKSFERDYSRVTVEGDISDYCLGLRQPGCQSMLLLRAEAVSEIMFDETISFGCDIDFNVRLSKRYHYRLLPQVGVRVWLNHEYERLSNDLLDSISFYEKHITTYSSDLRSHPEALADIYRRLGYLYLITKNWSGAARALFKALRLNFLNEMAQITIKGSQRLSGLLLRRRRVR